MVLTHGLDPSCSASCRCCTRRSCSASSPAARSSTGSPAPPRRRSPPAPIARSSSSRRNIKLEGATKASIEDTKKVVEICTQYAQKGMFNIFLAIFFSTLAFACLEPYFFIGYLISIALVRPLPGHLHGQRRRRLGQRQEGRRGRAQGEGHRLHAASVVGDTVGDPFKDTSSVAMNPVIKFTTLFGLLAVELGTQLETRTAMTLAAIFFFVSLFFVRSRSTACASRRTSPRPRRTRTPRRAARPRKQATVTLHPRGRTSVRPFFFFGTQM